MVDEMSATDEMVDARLVRLEAAAWSAHQEHRLTGDLCAQLVRAHQALQKQHLDLSQDFQRWCDELRKLGIPGPASSHGHGERGSYSASGEGSLDRRSAALSTLLKVPAVAASIVGRVGSGCFSCLCATSREALCTLGHVARASGTPDSERTCRWRRPDRHLSGTAGAAGRGRRDDAAQEEPLRCQELPRTPRFGSAPRLSDLGRAAPSLARTLHHCVKTKMLFHSFLDFRTLQGACVTSSIVCQLLAAGASTPSFSAQSGPFGEDPGRQRCEASSKAPLRMVGLSAILPAGARRAALSSACVEAGGSAAASRRPHPEDCRAARTVDGSSEGGPACQIVALPEQEEKEEEEEESRGGRPLLHILRQWQQPLFFVWPYLSSALGVEELCQLSVASSECCECLRTAGKVLEGRAVLSDDGRRPLWLQSCAGASGAEGVGQLTHTSPEGLERLCAASEEVQGEPQSASASAGARPAQECDGGGASRVRSVTLIRARRTSRTRIKPSMLLRGLSLPTCRVAEVGSPEQTPEPTLEETPASSSMALPQALVQACETASFTAVSWATIVRIKGLRSRPELNGRFGRLLHYSRDWERCHVMLSSGEGLRVRPENLVSMTQGQLSHQSAGESYAARLAPCSPDPPQPSRQRRRVRSFSPSRVSKLPKCPPAWCVAIKRGAILVAGGFNSRESTNAGFFFLPYMREWYRLPPMDRPRSYLGSALVDGHLYVFGGYNNEEVLDSVECLDTDIGCWESMPKMPNARAFANVAALGDHVYVCGGCGRMSVSLAGLDRFTLSSREWENLPSMQQPRTFAGLSVMEGHIYVVGGCNGQEQFHKNGECFSPSRARWIDFFQLLWRCVYGAQVVHNRYLYLCGGSEGSGARSDAARLRHGAGDWERLPSMRVGRMGALAAATPAGDIFVCGGKTGTAPLTELPLVEIFRGAAGVWEQLGGAAAQLCFCGSAQLGDHLYILGGRRAGADGEVTDCAGLLDLKGEEWHSLPPMPEPLAQGAYAAFHPRK